MPNRITFFAVDNGDAVLLEAHGQTIMTDINYRVACSDEENDNANDFAPIIRKACNDDRLDVFVLTHPDQDHLRGYGEIFHLGKPDARDPDPDEGDVKILVSEIWCTEYGANPNYTTDVSKPVLDEIKRRKKLVGTREGEEDGNRIQILTSGDGAQQSLVAGLSWRLIAPNAEEASIPKPKEGEPNNSSNPSSLVIQWEITVGETVSKVLLGGDSTVEVWERINSEFSNEKVDWHVLLAPHHCSRRSMGRSATKNGNEVFEWSDGALAGLDHPISARPYVVSSSSKFNASTPPNPKAREKYYKILAKGGEVDDAVRGRFLVTAGNKGDEAEDIVFEFKSSGLVRKLAGTSASPAIISTPASAGGGGYG